MNVAILLLTGFSFILERFGYSINSNIDLHINRSMVCHMPSIVVQINHSKGAMGYMLHMGVFIHYR